MADFSQDDGCSDIWVEDGVLHGSGDCTVTNAGGVILHRGEAEGYRFPASGIYFVTRSSKVSKLAVTI